jgi:GT2 family glycosyltransferase
VIPARNAADTLPACLEALHRQTVAAGEILVVDDASSDQTAEVARANGASAVTLPRHIGPGAARAVGVESVRGDIIVFTDADCIAEPEFLARLVAPLRTGASATKGAYTTSQRGLVPRFIQQEFHERYELLTRAARPDFVDGHAVAYRRDHMEAAGGIDDTLTLSQNVELGYRLADQGRLVAFVPDARTEHRHPASVGAYARAKAWRAFWRVRSWRTHPHRAMTDSYTPWTLKVQGGLVLASACLAAWRLATGQSIWYLWTASAALSFAATALPFLVRAARNDTAVVLVAVPLLVVRATAVGLGAAAGLVSLAAYQAPRVVAVRRSPPVSDSP